jgi:hypothetical protein
MLLKKLEHQSKSTYQKANRKAQQKYYQKQKETVFPPLPPSSELKYKIIRDFCTETSPEMFTESECAVCGKLTALNHLSGLQEVKNLDLLKRDGVT